MNEVETKEFTFSLLRYSPPGNKPVEIGVILFCKNEDSLALRITTDFTKIRRMDRPVFAGLASSIISWAQQAGATEVLRRLETTLSNSLTISDRLPACVSDLQISLDTLFLKYVGVK